MVSKREARANRRKALADTWERMTTVAKIRKLYASGRPRKRDQILSPITAYGQAGTLFERLQADMTLAKLDPADARALLVVNLLDQDPPVAMPFPVSRATMDETLMALIKIPQGLPVGVVFSITDHEETDPEKRYKQWASPFLEGPAATESLRQVLDDIKAEKKADA